MVRDGEVLGALILPPDLLDQLRSLTSLDPEQPVVDVLVNEDDPVKAQLVDDRISALVTEANLILSQRISSQAADYIDLLIEGGTFSIPLIGDEIDILGLARAGEILERIERRARARPGPRRAGTGRRVRAARPGEPGLRAAAARRGRAADRGREGWSSPRRPRRSTRSRSRSRRR